MKLHIANFYDAPRNTAVAGEDIAMGAVIAISNVSGARTAMQLTDDDEDLLLPGMYGIAYKVSVESLQVSETLYGVPVDWGSRVVAISEGDLIVQVGRTAIVEYEPSLLHASLDPARAGTLPVVGETLGIKGGLFCKANVTDAIVAPVIGRVFDVLSGKVRVELV